MSGKITVIVVDGAPGSGKDDFLSRIKAEPWFVQHVFIMDEVAAFITLRLGITREMKGAWPSVLWESFQKIISECSWLALATAFQRAERDGRRVIILNRYIPSGAAYLEDGLDELKQITGMSREVMSFGIDHVIIPGPPPVEHYVQHQDDDPNGFRFESYEEACMLGAKARRAYVDLGFVPGDRLHDVPGRENFEEKYQDFLKLVYRLVDVEDRAV